MHPNTFLKIVMNEAGLKNLDEARIATRVVFDLLHHRITREEADDLKAQLPQDLAEIWDGGPVWYNKILSRFEPHNEFNRIEFIDQVNSRKGNLMSTGEKISRAVFYALQSQITAGEADHVAGQLPKDLKLLWKESRPLKAYSGLGGGESEEVSEAAGI